MLSYLHDRYKNIDDILLITEINRDEMLKYKEVYSTALKKDHIKYATFDFLENDNDIEGKIKKFLNNKCELSPCFMEPFPCNYIFPIESSFLGFLQEIILALFFKMFAFVISFPYLGKYCSMSYAILYYRDS